MDIQILNTYDSEANKVAHSGYLTRAPAIRKSDVIAAELVRQATERNIKIQYDITYENHPHELTFTECFGGAGGIYIRPADTEFSRELLQTGPAGNRNVDFLLETFSTVYSLAPIHRIATRLRVILSGTDDKHITERVLLAMLYDMLDDLENPEASDLSKNSNMILDHFSDIIVGNTKEETMKMIILFTYHMIVWLEESIDRNDRWKLVE